MESSSSPQLQDHITCTVCLQVYTAPHALRCLHTFCHQCIQKLDDGNLIECPMCRNITPSSEIQMDFKTEALIDTLKRHNYGDSVKSDTCPPPMCEMCEDQTSPVVSKCNDCDQFMCERCQVTHSRMKVAKDHSVQTLNVDKDSCQLNEISDDSCMIKETSDKTNEQKEQECDNKLIENNNTKEAGEKNENSTPKCDDITCSSAQQQQQSIENDKVKQLQGETNQTNGYDQKYKTDLTSSRSDCHNSSEIYRTQEVTGCNKRVCNDNHCQDQRHFNSKDQRQFNSKDQRQFNSQDQRQLNSQNQRQFNSRDQRQFNSQDQRLFSSKDQRQFNSQDQRQFNKKVTRPQQLDKHHIQNNRSHSLNKGITIISPSFVRRRIEYNQPKSQQQLNHVQQQQARNRTSSPSLKTNSALHLSTNGKDGRKKPPIFSKLDTWSGKNSTPSLPNSEGKENKKKKSRWGRLFRWGSGKHKTTKDYWNDKRCDEFDDIRNRYGDRVMELRDREEDWMEEDKDRYDYDKNDYWNDRRIQRDDRCGDWNEEQWQDNKNETESNRNESESNRWLEMAHSRDGLDRRHNNPGDQRRDRSDSREENRSSDGLSRSDCSSRMSHSNSSSRIKSSDMSVVSVRNRPRNDGDDDDDRLQAENEARINHQIETVAFGECVGGGGRRNENVNPSKNDKILRIKNNRSTQRQNESNSGKNESNFAIDINRLNITDSTNVNISDRETDGYVKGNQGTNRNIDMHENYRPRFSCKQDRDEEYFHEDYCNNEGNSSHNKHGGYRDVHHNRKCVNFTSNPTTSHYQIRHGNRGSQNDYNNTCVKQRIDDDHDFDDANRILSHDHQKSSFHSGNSFTARNKPDYHHHGNHRDNGYNMSDRNETHDYENRTNNEIEGECNSGKTTRTSSDKNSDTNTSFQQDQFSGNNHLSSEINNGHDEAEEKELQQQQFIIEEPDSYSYADHVLEDHESGWDHGQDHDDEVADVWYDHSNDLVFPEDSYTGYTGDDYNTNDDWGYDYDGGGGNDDWDY